MTDMELNNPSELDAAIAVVKQAGYVVEHSRAYRKREAARAERLADCSTQNDRGEWVPAIPEPLFLSFGRVRCDCGEVRRGRLRYREHYALAHIMGLGA